MEAAITLLATPLVVVAIVNLLKRIPQIDTAVATLLGVLIGTALGVSDFYLADVGVYAAATGAFQMSMAALGLYDLAKTDLTGRRYESTE